MKFKIMLRDAHGEIFKVFRFESIDEESAIVIARAYWNEYSECYDECCYALLITDDNMLLRQYAEVENY